MEERAAEERQQAMEKALRERRWRAAAHIQRFWQGYKVRKVRLLLSLGFEQIELTAKFRASKPRRRRRRAKARKVARARNNTDTRILFLFSFLRLLLLFYSSKIRSTEINRKKDE